LAASLVGGAIYQAFVRIWVAKTLGLHPTDVTLRAFGSWGNVLATARQRLVLGLTVPLMTLGMAAALAAMPPHGVGWQGLSLLPPELTGQLTAASVLIACVWMLTVQAIAQTLPLPGCHGRETLVACVDVALERWPVLNREAAVRLALGMMAIGWLATSLVVLALVPTSLLPVWPWLALIGIACWISRAAAVPELGIPLTDLAGKPSDAASPGFASPPVSPWQAWRNWKSRRRLRAIRAREVLEAIDSEQLDGILQRLHEQGAKSLSAADKAVLQRVSGRLRVERGEGHVPSGGQRT